MYNYWIASVRVTKSKINDFFLTLGFHECLAYRQLLEIMENEFTNIFKINFL